MQHSPPVTVPEAGQPARGVRGARGAAPPRARRRAAARGARRGAAADGSRASRTPMRPTGRPADRSGAAADRDARAEPGCAPRPSPYPPAMVTVLALTTLDMVVLGLVAVFALRGAFKGFVWQTVRLIALFGAVWGAGAWHGWLAERLGTWFTFLPSRAVPVISWVVIFVLLMILGSYL